MQGDFGLDEKEIKKIIEKHFEENADLLIGIDDPEINEMINVLTKAFIEVISTNNDVITKNVESCIKEAFSKGGLTDSFGRSVFR